MAEDAATTPCSSASGKPRKRLKPAWDGRTRAARLLKQTEANLAAPLGAVAALSPAERLSVRNAAALSVRLEAVRSGLANGMAGITDEDLLRLSNGLSRALATLDRLAAARRKAATPPSPLRAYLEGRARRAEAVA